MSCPALPVPRLALALLVPGIGAQDAYDALAPDHLAFPTDGPDRCSYLHVLTSSRGVRSGPAQDIGSVRHDGNGVLEVRREAPVPGRRGPPVVLHVYLGTPGIHHRLDREHQPLREPHPSGPGPVVRHLRVLVQAAPDAVADELAHEREARTLGDVLDGAGDVGDV